MDKIKRSAIIYILYGPLLMLSALFQLLNIENGLAGIVIIVASIFALIFSITFIRIGLNLFSLLKEQNDTIQKIEESKLIKKPGRVMFTITTIWFGFNLLGVILHTLAYFF
jgi:hypothetical protein